MINPEQVSSYQVARSFCNKSILSNPKLQSNFLNAELVNLGIRGGEKRRGKSLVSLAGRMGADRRCCRSLLKRWCIQYDIETRAEVSVPFLPVYFRTWEGYPAVEGLREVNTWNQAVDFKAAGSSARALGLAHLGCRFSNCASLYATKLILIKLLKNIFHGIFLTKKYTNGLNLSTIVGNNQVRKLFWQCHCMWSRSTRTICQRCFFNEANVVLNVFTCKKKH